MSVLDTYLPIRSDSLEMARLKSDVDISQLSIGSQGPFPAHQFHFLMRQHSLAALELARMQNERNKLERQVVDLAKCDDDPREGFYSENAVVDCKIQIEHLDLSIRNKQAMCDAFEKCRQTLISQNNNKPYTDAEYQAEDPAYWQWYFATMIHRIAAQKVTQIPEGVLKSMEQLIQPPLLPGCQVALPKGLENTSLYLLPQPDSK